MNSLTVAKESLSCMEHQRPLLPLKWHKPRATTCQKEMVSFVKQGKWLHHLALGGQSHRGVSVLFSVAKGQSLSKQVNDATIPGGYRGFGFWFSATCVPCSSLLFSLGFWFFSEAGVIIHPPSHVTGDVLGTQHTVGVTSSLIKQ
ncbi:hypothetical protein H1C71_028499 [Ictidomys tridecemlineatus]|nr:hypothetical protein H1C71_028499 [Ictidomys tridecemlineatus]